jgi:nucleoid-associated protein YgaU
LKPDRASTSGAFESRRCSAAAAAALALLLAVPAAAQQIHRVQAGETLAAIATRRYGDASLADVLAAHNGLAGAPAAGTELRLPSGSRHTVTRGESWEDLAARYWDDAALGPVLAAWLGAGSGPAPAPGSSVEIPALFTYRLKPGETLVGLARRHYRDVSRAQLLARLNALRDPDRVPAGRKLRVPIAARLLADDALVQNASATPVQSVAAKSGVMTPSQPGPDVASRPGPRSTPDPVSAALMTAINAYLDGSFETALEQLEAQRSRVLAEGSPEERKVLLQYLIFSYVAFDRDDAACDAYAALRKVERPPRLSPELVSPKIRDALATCD